MLVQSLARAATHGRRPVGFAGVHSERGASGPCGRTARCSWRGARKQAASADPDFGVAFRPTAIRG